MSYFFKLFFLVYYVININMLVGFIEVRVVVFCIVFGNLFECEGYCRMWDLVRNLL